MKKTYNLFFVFAALCLIAAFGLSTPAQAAMPQQDALIEQGKYIASIAGCIDCHTPYKAEYQNPAELTMEQIQTIAFNGSNAADTSKTMAGGRVFDLGPAGKVYTANITPDLETGIGAWSDQEIRVSIRTGLTPSGEVLYPIMPYHNFNGMADADLDALIAYLRSVPAVKNSVPASTVSKEGLQPLPYRDGIVAPDSSDTSARGEYLVKVITGCTDCHTPIDQSTGTPRFDLYLGGGQPYEGPWGIVYGGNITPDPTTGIGDWTEAEIKRAIVAGVNKDNRQLILMPWFAYTVLTPADADAMAYYLKNELPAVNNEVPAISLNEPFNVQAPQAPVANSSPINLPVVITLAVIAAALVATFLFMRAGKQA